MTVLSARKVRPTPVSAFPVLLRAVSRVYDVSPHELIGRKRIRWMVWPRQSLYLLASELFCWGSPTVAKVMKVDASTVLYGRRMAMERIASDESERNRFKRALSAYIEDAIAAQSGGE